MRKIIDVNIGKVNFVIEDDAYFRLKDYLNLFEQTLKNEQDVHEVMEDVENRIAEIFIREKKYPEQVIDVKMVQNVIDILGDIEMSQSGSKTYESEKEFEHGEKRLMRNLDDKMIGGVCSGLAAYFDIDTTLMRILFVLSLFLSVGTTSFIYLILWFVMPKAITVAQKLQMRGYATTADNIRKYTNTYK